MDKPRIKEAIVVEGRYDKNTLSQVVDAAILETAGFGVFKDGEKLSLLRRIAQKQGLIILTDSDGAGFVIRNYLKGSIDPSLVKHAYIPDREGKERRKLTAGKEGKLGVEGMRPDVLLDALHRAGATFLGEDAPVSCARLTKADLFADGLCGVAGSEDRRRRFARAAGLPERISANALLDFINACFEREQYLRLLEESAQTNC